MITSGEIDFKQLMTAMMALMLSAIGLGQALLGLGDQKEGLLAAKRIFNSIEDGINSTIDGLSQTGLKPPTRATGVSLGGNQQSSRGRTSSYTTTNAFFPYQHLLSKIIHPPIQDEHFLSLLKLLLNNIISFSFAPQSLFSSPHNHSLPHFSFHRSY